MSHKDTKHTKKNLSELCAFVEKKRLAQEVYCLFDSIGFFLRIPLHQKEKILLNRQVTILVAEIIHRSLFGFVGMRDVVEAKSFFVEFFFMHVGFSVSLLNFFQKYSSVLAQNSIHRTHVVGGVAVLLVVVRISAQVGTEFFIYPAFDGLFAFGAFLFHEIFLNYMHFFVNTILTFCVIKKLAISEHKTVKATQMFVWKTELDLTTEPPIS